MTAQKKRRFAGWKPALLALFIVLLAVYIFYPRYATHKRQSALLRTVEQIDTTGVEPQVIQKIQKLIADTHHHPESADVWGKLAMNLDVHDYKTESLPIYTEAARLDPSNLRWPYFAALVLFNSGDQQSLEWFARAEQANPHYAPLLINYGNALARFGKAKEAEAKYKQAQNLNSSQPVADPIYAELTKEGASSLWYRFRGSEFLKNGMYDRAITEFRHALQLHSDVQTKEDLAKALNAAKKYSEALEVYQTVLPQRPTAENHFGIGLAHANLGSYAEAERFFQKAIEQKPQFAEAYFNMAVLFAKRGKLQETIRNLKEAVLVKPDYAQAHYHLGLAYIAAQQRDAALKEYGVLEQLDSKLAERLRTSIESSDHPETE